ncbi:MAG: PEP-CTERM system TPR-repeat protein PrsT [Burkholderiales bacterium]|nr:PEP-CTERM system TPR-repeat protein PrsT [Burkholderiales bacterium]
MTSNAFLSRAARCALLAALALAAAACNRTPSLEQLLADAKSNRDKGNYTAAIIHLKNAVQVDPKSAETRFLLGTAFLETGDSAAAEIELRRALDMGYGRGRVIPPLGKAILMSGNYKKVLDEITLDPNLTDELQAHILALRGIATIGLRRNEEGRKLLEQALAKQPDHAEALLGMARLAALERKSDASADYVERAIKGDPKNLDAWLARGDLRRVAGDSAGALASYAKVLEIQPDNVPARLNIASLHIADSKFDEARAQLEAVRKIAPRNLMVRYLTGLLEFRQHNFTAARDAVLQVLTTAPDHMPSVLLAGAAQYALGSHVQAQSHLARVLEVAPGNLYARKLLAASYSKSGQAERAMELLKPVLDRGIEDASLYALAGEVSLQTSDFPGAQRFFERAAKAEPKSAQVRAGLGVSRLASGETERAFSDLEAATQLDSEKYQADILLAMSHLRRRNFDLALKAVQGLEKKQPNNPLTHNLKAAVFVGRKDLAQARKELERALSLQPNYLPAAANLAQLDLQNKDPKAARKRFEDILAKEPKHVATLVALAGFARALGATPKEQLDWLERARQADPALVRPQVLLARAYLQTGDAKKALEVAQRAQVSNPDNADVLDVLGSVQVAVGERNQAVTTYRKLADLQPRSPLVYYRLGGAQALNGEVPAATESMKKALALKPDYTEARVALAQLQARAGRHSEAVKIARQVQKDAPKSSLGTALEGDILMSERKFAEAARAYEGAYQTQRAPDLVAKIHTAYGAAGNAAKADAALAAGLKEFPDNLGLRLYSAEHALRSANHRSAIEQYEQIDQKQPNNFLVLNNLAWSYQQVKDPRALATAERAYKLRPDNPLVGDTLGWMLVEQGNVSRGLELLRKAAAQAPKSGDVRLHLVQALARSGDKSGARVEAERLVKDLPAYVKTRQAQEVLAQIR